MVIQLVGGLHHKVHACDIFMILLDLPCQTERWLELGVFLILLLRLALYILIVLVKYLNGHIILLLEFFQEVVVSLVIATRVGRDALLLNDLMKRLVLVALR